MSKIIESAERNVLGARLRDARLALPGKVNQEEMARRISELSGVQVSRDRYAKYEFRTDLPRELAAAVSQITGLDPLYFLDPNIPGNKLPPISHLSAVNWEKIKPVPVNGRVQAGQFTESGELQPEEIDVAFVSSDVPFANKPLRGFKVFGDSMNEFYPHGSVVIVAPSIYLGEGWMPTPGMHVIVQRLNDWGEQELTIKEIEYGPPPAPGQDPEYLLLKPRSTNPEFKPWRYPISRDPDSIAEEKMRIIGVVVTSTKRAPGF